MLVFRKILRKNWIKDPYIVSRYFWWHHIQRIIFTTTILDDLWFKASVFLLKAVVILAMRVVIFLLSISVCSSLVSMPIKGEQKPQLTGFYKSSHPEVLCEKRSKNFAKFTGKQLPLPESRFWRKLQDWSFHLHWKETRHSCFTVNFTKYFWSKVL